MCVSMKGSMTCLFRQTLKCGDLSSRVSSRVCSLNHCGATLAMAWVTSLSVGLGSILGLIDS